MAKSVSVSPVGLLCRSFLSAQLRTPMERAGRIRLHVSWAIAAKSPLSERCCGDVFCVVGCIVAFVAVEDLVITTVKFCGCTLLVSVVVQKKAADTSRMAQKTPLLLSKALN